MDSLKSPVTVLAGTVLVGLAVGWAWHTPYARRCVECDLPLVPLRERTQLHNYKCPRCGMRYSVPRSADPLAR